MPDSYQLPPAGRTFMYEEEIKRSRFIALARRAHDEGQARAFIDEVRADYPDARHHCSAYYFQVPGSNPVERSSDDGEPSGTAGKPMLDVVKGSGLSDVVVVVVRYFGGVKLGAGGLVHAYSGATSGVLDTIVPVTRSLRELYAVEVPHTEAGKVEAELRNRGVVVVDTAYAAAVTLTVAVAPGGVDKLNDTIAALTQGRVEARRAGESWIESDKLQ